MTSSMYRQHTLFSIHDNSSTKVYLPRTIKGLVANTLNYHTGKEDCCLVLLGKEEIAISAENPQDPSSTLAHAMKHLDQLVSQGSPRKGI